MAKRKRLIVAVDGNAHMIDEREFTLEIEGISSPKPKSSYNPDQDQWHLATYDF